MSAEKKLPAGWEVKKLGELLSIERGGSPRPIDAYLTDDPNGINWIKIGDTQGIIKYITSTKERIIPEGVRRSRMVYEGDFILSNSMSFGHPYIMKTSGCIHDGWLVLHPLEQNIDQDFLYHLLGSPFVYNQFDTLASGSTVRNLNIDLVKRVSIPLPPLSEQKRIVAIFDEAFQAIDKAKENAQKNLANARELFEDYLNQISKDKQPLGDFVDIRTGKLDANAAVKNGKYSFFTCSKDVFQIDNYAFDCEAILLAGNNAVGDFNVKYYKGKFNAYQRTYVLTVKDEKKLSYRHLYFQLQKSLKELKAQSVGAATKFLKLGMIQNLLISIPAYSEQQNIVNKLDALSSEIVRLESIYTKKLAALDELKKSILQKAFSGEL